MMRSWAIGVCVLLLVSAASAQERREPSSLQSPSWYTMSFSDGIEVRVLPPVVTSEDYPRVATRMGLEGTTILKLQVDPSGQITSCATAQSAGIPELDEQACRLYRSRARFEVRGTTRPVALIAPMKWVLMDSE
jgi:TonB family protein